MNKYSISADGAGEKVKLNVPSPLFNAGGPAVGSQFQNGPVNLNTVLLSGAPQTSVVMTRSVDATGHGLQLQ